jgi:hypothetical protein
MIPDWHVPYSVKSVSDRPVFGYALVGKMQVMEVTMENPPAVLVAVLVFGPSF